MKIAIFVPFIDKTFEYKDPGQIAKGLVEIGNEVTFITLKAYYKDFSFPFIETSLKNLKNENFYKNLNFDFIIFYSWLSIKFNKIIEAAKNSGLKVIIKLDYDGRIGFPQFLSRLRGFDSIKNFQELIEYLTWLFRWIAFGTILLREKIKQLYIVDKVIIESPQALINLLTFLSKHNKLEELIFKKISVIPNPVDDKFMQEPYNKENIILSAANFDNRAKNRKNLYKLIKEFLKIKTNWKFILIGNGVNYFSNLSSERVILKEEISHNDIVEYFRKAKIFLLPSFWEGFNISAAEAVCSGNSIVGTPLECLYYLTNNNFSGTIATGFDYKSLLASLLIDTEKWENNIYDPLKISKYWQNLLNRRKVANEIIRLFLSS